MAKKRERLEIIRDILKVLEDKREIKPTRLLYASNLSPQMFKEYITELLEKELIEKNEIKKKNFFTLTTKGNNFLEEYRLIDNFVQNFGL